MPVEINQLSIKLYEELLRPIFEYLRIEDKLASSDVIFVFGSRNLMVAKETVRLWKLNLAPIILCTGKNAGADSGFRFTESEAGFMAKELVSSGVSSQNIIREQEATNTLENVILGVELLRRKNLKINSAILVAKPFHLRRCRATFKQCYPEITVRCSPPQGSVTEVMDRSRAEYAKRLAEEVNRLRIYANKGDIAKENIPDHVLKSIKKLKDYI